MIFVIEQPFIMQQNKVGLFSLLFLFFFLSFSFSGVFLKIWLIFFFFEIGQPQTVRILLEYGASVATQVCFFLSFFLSIFPLWAHNNVVTPPVKRVPVKSPGHPFLSLPSSSSVLSFVLFFFCLDAWPKSQCCPIDSCPSFVSNIFLPFSSSSSQ